MDRMGAFTSEPLAIGVAASALAALQLFGWAALGSVFLGQSRRDAAALPLALLIGSGITSFLYALLTATSQVVAAIALGLMGSALSAVAGRRAAWCMVRDLAGSFQHLWRGSRWLLAISAATIGLYWALAIVPPRDADVMRYHLAHIRQIDLDGSWQAIPDYHYALPFGWSLTYLPFEHLGLPQVAHLLNFGLWIVTVGALYAALKGHIRREAALLPCALVAFQPQVVKAATTAHADMYAIFVVLAVALLAARLARLDVQGYALLGFAAWIGAQSRYQALALGLATTLLVLFLAWRRKASPPALVAFGAGSSAALLLSAPFYVFNLLAFQNPVWPLMIPAFNGLTSYADQVANAYNVSMTGSLTLDTATRSLGRLLVDWTVFPIPILAFALVPAALRRPAGPVRAIPALVGLFLLVWVLAEPILYARFSLLLLPLVAVGWAPMLDWLVPRLKRWLPAGAGLALLGVAAFLGLYSYDSLEYIASRDVAAFHRYTWFYDAYDWANRSTPADARFLVIVTSGHSYYLDRPYRRADPWLTGQVNWPTLQGAQDMDRLMEAEGYRYMIYEQRDWSRYLGGQNMMTVIQAAVDQGVLSRVAVFDGDLGTSRLGRQTYATQVSILSRVD